MLKMQMTILADIHRNVAKSHIQLTLPSNLDQSPYSVPTLGIAVQIALVKLMPHSKGI